MIEVMPCEHVGCGEMIHFLRAGMLGRQVARPSFCVALLFWTGLAVAQERTFVVGHGVISHTAIAPSSKVLAVDASDISANAKLIILFDTSEQKKIGTIKYTPGGIAFNSLAFSKDGKSLVVAGGIRSATPEKTTIVSYWNVPSGRLAKSIEVDGQVIAMNDRYVVARDLAGGNWTKIYDTETGDKIAELASFSPRYENASISPDAKYLGLLDDRGSVRVFDLPSGKSRFTLEFAQSSLPRMLFPGRSTIVVAGGGATSTYDLKNGEPLAEAKALRFFSPDTISRDGRLMARKGEVMQRIEQSIKVHPDALHVLSTEKKKIIATFKVDPKWQIRTMQFTPDNQSLVATGGGGIVRIWDVSKLDR